MNIIFFAKGKRGQRCLDYLLQRDYQIQAVVTIQEEPALKTMIANREVPILIPEKVNTKRFAKTLKSYDPDLFVLSGYNKILRPVIFDIPPLGTINLHGGLLPEYRGAAPINWQIINGETIGGCSIIYVDEGIDTGDIIRQQYYRIHPEDTHASVLEKTLEIFPPLLRKVLEDIEKGQETVIPQDPEEGSYYTRRYPRDSKIDWKGMSDIEVHNLVRGMHGPYPAAFTFRGEQRVEIDRTTLINETVKGVPGRVPKQRENSVIVLAKNRGLLVDVIHVDGQSIPPAEFFNLGDDLR